MLKRELKMLFSSPWIWGAVALLMAATGLMSKDALFGPHMYATLGGDMWIPPAPSYVVDQFFGTAVQNVYPILCALPAAVFAFEEWSSGFNSMQLVRTAPGKYAARKLLTCGLTAVVMILIPMAFMWLVPVLRGSYSTYLFMENSRLPYGAVEYGEYFYAAATPAIRETVFPAIKVNSDFFFIGDMNYRLAVLEQLPLGVYIWADTKLVLLQMLWAAIMAMCWSSLALAASVWLGSRYMTLILPVAVYRFFVMNFLQLPQAVFEWIDYGGLLYGGTRNPLFLMAAVQVGFGVVWMLLYVWGVKRRAQHG